MKLTTYAPVLGSFWTFLCHEGFEVYTTKSVADENAKQQLQPSGYFVDLVNAEGIFAKFKRLKLGSGKRY